LLNETGRSFRHPLLLAEASIPFAPPMNRPAKTWRQKDEIPFFASMFLPSRVQCAAMMRRCLPALLPVAARVF